MRKKVYIFNRKDRILYKIMAKVFKKYSWEIYRRGLLVGFNWNYKVDKVNDLSTLRKFCKNIKK